MVRSYTNLVHNSDTLEIHEWPRPLCEIVGKRGDIKTYVTIHSKEDALALIDSLQRMVCAIEGFET